MATRKKFIRRAIHSKENPYLMVKRTTVQDDNLSYEARGMLTYILSQPDNWRVQPAELVNKSCGRDKVYRILKELIEARYIEHEKTFNEHHRIIWGDYVVHETPYPENPDMKSYTDNQEMKSGRKPLPEIPDTENPDSIKYLNLGISKDTLLPDGKVKPRNVWYDAIFEIWKYTAARNTVMAQMLQGVAKQKGYKEFNLEKPITPKQALAWACWYRKTEFQNNPKMSMLAEPIKVQSSISTWLELGEPDVRAPKILQFAPIDPADYPDTADYYDYVNGEKAVNS